MAFRPVLSLLLALALAFVPIGGAIAPTSTVVSVVLSTDCPDNCPCDQGKARPPCQEAGPCAVACAVAGAGGLVPRPVALALESMGGERPLPGGLDPPDSALDPPRRPPRA